MAQTAGFPEQCFVFFARYHASYHAFRSLHTFYPKYENVSTFSKVQPMNTANPVPYELMDQSGMWVGSMKFHGYTAPT